MPAPEACLMIWPQLVFSAVNSLESRGAFWNSSTEVLVTNAKLGGRLLAIDSA